MRARSEPPDRWPRFGLLLGSVIASVAVQGAIPPGAVQHLLVSVLLGSSLILAFHVARVSRTLMWLAYLVAAAGVAAAGLRELTGVVGDGETLVMNALLVALGPPAVALGVVRTLRSRREVQVQAVMGVLSLYMLLGMFFASLYGAIDELGGHPFFTDGTRPRCRSASTTASRRSPRSATATSRRGPTSGTRSRPSRR